MKKLLSILFVVFALVLALASCGGQGEVTQPTTTNPEPPVHEHSYNAEVIAPLCVEQGYTTHICVCGDFYIDTYVDALGHNFIDGTCTRCELAKSSLASEGLAFTLNSDGQSYAVTGIGTCTDTDIVIPSTYEELPVTSIGFGAFYGCSSLTSVTIPDSVTSIDDYAFNSCSLLTNIVIPNSVTHIGFQTFYSCSSLGSIVIPDSITSIGASAFYNCPSLQFNEYDNAYYLGNESNPHLVLINAKNTNITSCKINSGTRMIYSSAFSRCSSLTEIEFPNSLKSIGDSAFYNCSSLKSIVIPDSILNIDNQAFSGCMSLTNIIFGENCQLMSIGDWAFYNCSSLANILIPDSVTNIGGHAFGGCSLFTSVVIPASVSKIGEGPFENCSSLTSIEVDKNNAYYKSIEGNLYDNETLIQYAIGKTDTTFVIPESVTSIGNYAFYSCHSITNIVIPDCITNIGKSTFEYCTSLTSIKIPDLVTSIGKGAFYHCSSLASVIFGENSQLTSIENYAFLGCSSLTSIDIPNSVTTIGNFAFYKCTSLTNIVIPNSVISIGQDSFANCNELIIYCEATSQPSGWHSSWNSDTLPVVWGYKPE